MVRERGWHVRVLLLAVALLAPALAFSQQPPDTGTTQDPGPASPPTQTQTSGTESGTTQSQPNAAAGTQGLFARALNSASPLAGENGPLQWGWLSVRQASFSEYFTNVSLEIPGMQPVRQDLNASQLSTTIVATHAFGASRSTQLTVQYAPSLFITDGHVHTDALNQNAGLDTTFELSPRWALQVSDHFSYFGSQRSFSGLQLDANFSLGTVVQNNFLNGPGRVIYNALSASFTYLWSPVTTVIFAPTFGYENATGAADSKQNLSALYAGGQLTVSHMLSATQTVGISYKAQHALYTNTSSTAGPQANSWQQDFLVSYGQQFGATWRLSLGSGVTSSTGITTPIGLGVTAGLTKSFQRMDFALSYNRGHQFNGYITAASTDRADLLNTIRWGRRFRTSTSVAYFRTASSPTPGTSGIYATEQLNFVLTPSLSLTGGISYTKQTGDGVYVQNSRRRLGTAGVTWAPRAPVKY